MPATPPSAQPPSATVSKALALAATLRSRGAGGAELAFVLGSGLGALAERVEGGLAIPFDELDGMPHSSVPGHAGRFVRGRLNGVEVLVQQGRVHLYEGWTAAEVTRSVRAFGELGIDGLVLTNAAGGLVPAWTPPTLMAIRDHLALQGAAPLVRGEGGIASPYDEAARAVLHASADQLGLNLEEGVYAALLGPTYETPAEIRHLARLGAQAVGMSTALEASTGYCCGLRVAAISCISNAAAGISPTPLSHSEVVQAGAAIARDFCDLLEQAVPQLAKCSGSTTR